MARATTPCAHCGLPAPAGAESEPAFCCRGCRTVWDLVHEAGLDNYYALRERLDAHAPPGSGQSSQAAEAPAYAHLDDPTVLAQVRVDDRPGTASLHCTGMHCAACVWLIERLPRVVDGLDSARVDFGSARVVLDWDPDVVALSRVAALFHRAGYELHAVDAQAEQTRRDDRRRELVRLAIAGASAGNVMLVSFALYAGALSGMEAHWSRFFEFAALILAIPAVAYGGLPFYRAAWAGLRARTLHIDLPIALGVLGGFVASVVATFTSGEVYFDSVSVLVFLLLIGRHVQRRGQQWALSQTDLIQLLVPARARRILADGRREDCSSNALAVGEHIEVRRGERIPADAQVLRGRASIDASSLTGESTPVSVEPGDAVLAGTIAVDGGCELEVRAVGAATRVGSLAARIMQADAVRAPIQRAVDRISGYFVATVLSLAVLGGLAWWLVDPSRVFSVVVALLVISCPCALGLATPVALALARARAARRGILLASAGALEALAKVETAVFDKTGTLTEGALEVHTATVIAPLDEAELAGLILAVERGSGHPVAQALRRWARARVDARPERAASSIEVLVGKGRAAVFDAADGRPRAQVRIGNLAWLDHRELFGDDLTQALSTGKTPVLVELDDRPVAMLALADTVRPDAAVALDRLRALGLQLAIRSGDHPAAVGAVARELGIEDFAGAMTPEAKARTLARLPAAAMIGDGVNDAPAMRAASVGVAVRGGAEVALRTADVHLAEPGLAEVAELFEGARRTMAIIRRNLGFSLGYNLVFASLALAGLVGPLAAALLMPASSLTVVLSSALSRSFDDRRAGAKRTRSEPRELFGSGSIAGCDSLARPGASSAN
ncbi:Copper-exporting P-type ATPase A [Enhygromyxa salina]|uniref:Copper-exporting P-type ATPase A n=1 Tax=Enhygromyxa salina TaxID=215803 RepID=A0A2S9XUQ6_9BACT|nr:heavy metal translocating P-type ATPase [Enhygromyxa salina]PRP96595.1 Copper-exporting P-type ATPase A [Enhygromyxa salina]